MKKVKDSNVIAENQRSRNWCLVLYQDDDTHTGCLNRLTRGYNYVGILHDADLTEDGEPKKNHYHIVLKFPQARWRTAVAEELGIEPNYLQVCRSLDGAYCYLTHFGLPNTHQYNHEELFGTLYKDACKAMQQETDQNERVLTLLALIDSQGVLDEWKLIELACRNGLYGDLIRMGSLVSKLIELHNYRVMDDGIRDGFRKAKEAENAFEETSKAEDYEQIPF